MTRYSPKVGNLDYCRNRCNKNGQYVEACRIQHGCN
jgi:hypothetical protein